MLIWNTNKNFLKMCGEKINFKYLYIKENTMSKEMREHINRVKNFSQFLNENKMIEINGNIISFNDLFFDVDKEDYEKLKNDYRVVFVQQSPQNGKFIFVIPEDNLKLFSGIISDELGLDDLRLLNFYEKESIKLFW